MLSSKSLLFLCAACAFGADEKPAGVAGMVTNALTGEPVARAQVSLNGMGRRLPGVTSEAGKFSITDVPAGAYMVFVRRVGFTQTADRTAKNWVEIVLRAGDSKDDLKLKLTPAGAITGRVIDADGEPMEAVMVSGDSGLGNFTATTADNGQYR